jgi:hypothetical protein
MDSNGWDFSIEINEAGANHTAVKAWTDPDIQKIIQKIPRTFQDLIAVTPSASLYYQVTMNPGSLKDFDVPFGDVPFYLKLAAKTTERLLVRLFFPLQVELRVELRTGGDLTGYLESGEFLHTSLNVLCLADGAAGFSEVGTENESVSVAIKDLQLRDLKFLGKTPPAHVQEMLKKLIAPFLRTLLEPVKAWPLTPLYKKLAAGLPLVTQIHDQIVFTSFGDNNYKHNVTPIPDGQEFIEPVDTTIRISLALDIGTDDAWAKPPPPRTDIIKLPVRLGNRNQSELSLTLSQRVLTLFEKAVVSDLIRKQWHDAIQGDPQNDGLLRFAMSGKDFNIVDNNDSDTFVLEAVHDLDIGLFGDNALYTSIDFREVELGPFGIDALRPDPKFTAHISYNLATKDDDGKNVVAYAPSIYAIENRNDWFEKAVIFGYSMVDLATALGDFVLGDLSDAGKAAIRGATFIAVLLLSLCPFLTIFFPIGSIPTNLKFQYHDTTIFMLGKGDCQNSDDYRRKSLSLYFKIV